MKSFLQRMPTAGSCAALAAAGLLSPLAQAGLTDIAQEPLLVSFGTPVKPNLLFILDDSGSMGEIYLPEAANRGADKYSVRTPQCNGLAFKEGDTYVPAVNYDGTSKAAGVIGNSFNASDALQNIRNLAEDNTVMVNNAARELTVSDGGRQAGWYQVGEPVTVYNGSSVKKWMIGYVVSWNKDTGKLNVNFIDYSSAADNTGTSAKVGRGWPHFVYFNYKGAQKPLDWTYDEAGSIGTTTDFYKECNSRVNVAPGSAVFERKIMRPTDGAAAQNFANWWTYYGNRIKMMRTVSASAFLGIDASFRVGFSRISTTEAKESGTKWLHVRDFEGGVGSQREKFYTALHGTNPSGYTPLRGALSVAGRYIANKAVAQDVDPVQYSCQKHFAILATDGAWNNNMETATFGPFDVAGALVGNRDGAAALAHLFKDTKGASNTLSDVAIYYFDTDLRSAALGNCAGEGGRDVCENNVSVVAGQRDTAKHQHLTTYTMSLGQNGTLKFCTGYETGCDQPKPVEPPLPAPPPVTSDYPAILGGTKTWPSPTNDATKVDDLWHAAVNGRGVFFNAADASGVADGLKRALTDIQKVDGRGSAGATSTTQPVGGDNFFYIAGFTSGTWEGDLKKHLVDVHTYEPDMTKSAWSASDKLPAPNDRKIFYAKGAALREFTYANLNVDGFGAQFQGRCAAMSHYLALGLADRASCDSGENLVSFLRGSSFTYYRSFGVKSRLADISGSTPAFDGSTGAAFKDAGYSAFVSGTRATRSKMVYVGSNGGMLHAFDADSGVEQWAFIPTAVRSRLWALGDKSYNSKHEFFVDGPTVIEDVFDGAAWRTILVTGLGAGGRAYFALDVTDPATPKLLWEFTNANLGYTFAKPVIAKRANGTWVVVVPSGFNNVGDGQGRLFMLNAVTGAVLENLSTGEGTAADPAGLGPVTPWIDDGNTDATALRYYAGDNLGNVWRFDPDGLLVGASSKVIKLAALQKDGKAQPVTVPPLLGLMRVAGVETPVVAVGTGRMVGKTDLANTDVQSVYAIKDELGEGWGDIRAGGKLVAQEIVTDAGVRKGTAMSVEWKTKAGWVADLPDSGERINVPMVLFGSTLVAASNVPESIAGCEEGSQGHAWIYYFDMATGGVVADYLGDSMVAGLNAVGRGVLPVPSIASKNIKYREVRQPTGTATTPRRANWREVIDR